MDKVDVLTARRKAEAAVNDMPDGPLKVKAFEVILSRLLGAGHDTSPTDMQSSVTEHRATNKAPKSCAERILLLRAERFFNEPRSLGQIRDELATRGWNYPVTSLSGTAQALAQKLELRRTRTREGNRKGYRYVNP